MSAHSFAWRVSLCLTALALAACGGGGGGGSSALPPAPVSAGPAASPPPSSGPASVAISVAIPAAASASGRARSPRYVSAGTKSVAVAFAGNRQTADCGSSCSMTLAVSPGTITFDISLFDGPAGTGHVLSEGVTTATVVAGQQNAVRVTFQGVVAKVAVALAPSTVTAGAPASVPVTVTAQDAAGYTIVGSDPYQTPIALTTDDASGATALSTASVAAPGTPVTLAYNGSATVSAVHVGASAGSGVVVQSATLSVRSAPAPTPAPGSAPKHVATWYYYGLNGVNAPIPAAWMAAHADYAEDDGDTAQHAQAFKDAGGSYAVAYSDPAYTPYCFAPFSGPGAKCAGSIGKLVTDEAGWFHGADGTRVRRFVDSHFGYQEALNPASQSARDAFRTTTQQVLDAAPKLDYVMADDSGGVFLGDDGTSMSGWFYGFNAPAVEITTDAQFIPAQRQMFAASVRPVIVNGVNPATIQPAYNGAWLDSPNVAGQLYEGCYTDGTNVAGPNRNNWYLESNSILTAIAHRAKAICMMNASPTAAHRIYELASWWLTYTEPYSVAAPIAALSDGMTVAPEYDIVPRQPLATATTDVNALRSATGAYVREFAACYQGGTAIGPCAAVVNPTNGTVAVPALSGRYTAALGVDDRSAYAGGQAAWNGAVPAQLAPLTAVVLR
jgi:hypothetical protein